MWNLLKLLGDSNWIKKNARKLPHKLFMNSSRIANITVVKELSKGEAFREASKRNTIGVTDDCQIFVFLEKIGRGLSLISLCATNILTGGKITDLVGKLRKTDIPVFRNNTSLLNNK